MTRHQDASTLLHVLRTTALFVLSLLLYPTLRFTIYVIRTPTPSRFGL